MKNRKLSALSQSAIDAAKSDGWHQSGRNDFRRCTCFQIRNGITQSYTARIEHSKTMKEIILMYRSEVKINIGE